MMFRLRSICSREVMLAAPRLRGIVNPTIGWKPWTLRRQTTRVIVGTGNVRKFSRYGRATVMLILMLMYTPGQRGVLRAGGSVEADSERRLGRMPAAGARSLGGLGRIAAGRGGALGFGVNLVAFDPLSGRTGAGGSQDDGLDTLLRSSDVIAMLVSITPIAGCWATRARVDETVRRYLVNTSRASVDRRRALPALKEKRIAGAALAVSTVEPRPDDTPPAPGQRDPHAAHGGAHPDVFASFPPARWRHHAHLRGECLYCKNQRSFTPERRVAGSLCSRVFDRLFRLDTGILGIFAYFTRSAFMTSR